MMNTERRAQFFDRYPSMEEWLDLEGDPHDVLGMVDGGWKDKDIFHLIALERYEFKDDEIAKYAAAFLLLDAKRDWMFQPPAPYILKALLESGLTPEEGLYAYNNSSPYITIRSEFIAPATVNDPKYGGTMRSLLIAHHYRKANQEEMETLITGITRVFRSIYPTYITARGIGIPIGILEDKVDDMANTTMRKLLRIDQPDSGWASIKRMRKVVRKWNQVDGGFIEITGGALPYHLQNWMSPKGDTLDGYTFTPLTSDAELKKEGEYMNHCVSSFASLCLTPADNNVSHIYKIEGGERATLEVTWDNYDEEFIISQVYGKNNEEVSTELNKATKEFVDNLNREEFDHEKALDIRRKFHTKYKRKKVDRDRWKEGITYLLPHFPELQYLLNKEDDIMNNR